MDVPFHEVAQRLINHSMPRHGALAAEGFRNDGEPPVAAPRGPRTGVARMLRALVLDFQREWLEHGQPLAHRALDRVYHFAGPEGGSPAPRDAPWGPAFAGSSG